MHAGSSVAQSLAKLVVVSTTGLCAATVMAQTFPSKPVRLVVPYPPGGSVDVVARSIQQPFSKALNQTVLVDNRPGANSALGMEHVVRAPADGHTILVGGSVSNAALRKLPFDLLKDLTPVVGVGTQSYVLSVHPSLPSKTTKEFIAMVRSKPGELVYASSGVGGLTHMATELLASMAKLKMIHVPYKSTGAAMTDLLSGRAQLIVGSLLPTVPHFETGKLRPLAVTTAKRWYSLPNVPTVAETLPGYEVELWFGVMAPVAGCNPKFQIVPP